MRKRTVVLLLLVVALTNACGFFISKGPPPEHEKMDYFHCTESDAGPALDFGWAALNLVAALIIASDPSEWENTYQSDAGSAMMISFAWAIGSGISGAAGLGKTSACRKAKAQLAVRQTATRSAAATAAAAARGSAPVAVDPATVHLVQAILLAPQNVTLELGQTQQIVATAYHSSGVTIPDRHYTWSSSNDAIASVSDVGLVTANGAGFVTIAANTGSMVGTTRIQVLEPRRPPAADTSSLKMTDGSR